MSEKTAVYQTYSNNITSHENLPSDQKVDSLPSDQKVDSLPSDQKVDSISPPSPDVVQVSPKVNQNLVDSALYRYQTTSSISSSDSDSDLDSPINNIAKKPSNVDKEDFVEAQITEDLFEEMHRDFDKIMEEVCPRPIFQKLHAKVNLVEYGNIQSKIGDDTIVISSLPSKPALAEGTILFNQFRDPLGPILEIFGPVTSPLYVIILSSAILKQNIKLNPSEKLNEQIKNSGKMIDEYLSNNENNLANNLIQTKQVIEDSNHQKVLCNVGDMVYFTPNDPEYCKYLFPAKIVRTKGSDASWKNNKEPPEECLEFSDDEHEKEHKKNLKTKNKVTLLESTNVIKSYNKKMEYNGVQQDGVGNQAKNHQRTYPKPEMAKNDEGSSRQAIDGMIHALINNQPLKVPEILRSTVPHTYLRPTPPVYLPYPPSLPAQVSALLNQPAPLGYVPTPPSFGVGYMTQSSYGGPVDAASLHHRAEEEEGPPCLKGTHSDIVQFHKS